ncbi:MAG: DUF4419 domain-containing protein [Bacteroidota bacterium]
MSSINQVQQKSVVKIQVEDIPLATKPLQSITTELLIQKFNSKTISHSHLPEKLIDFGQHAFLAGMYQAYADHRPFTISPEMIWLLIQQGISVHFHHNQSSITKFFPELLERQTLMVRKPLLSNKTEEWRAVIEGFKPQMESYLGKEFISQFTGHFSESTADEITTSDLMIMDAMQPYFEYIVRMIICGIPIIQLEGKSSDWEKLLQKVIYFKQFDLAWWLEKIEPIILKIKAAAGGAVDVDFWRNMFKIHTKESYGRPKVIDGWITRFYPYDKRGNRILEKELEGLSIDRIFEYLPAELKIIPFKLELIDDDENVVKVISMSYSAGFIGLSQDEESLNLRPEIGWLLGKAIKHQPKPLDYESSWPESRQYFSLETFPVELLADITYDELELNYKNEIHVPENITEIKASFLMLNGKISPKEKALLKKKFEGHEVRLVINQEWDDEPEDIESYFE